MDAAGAVQAAGAEALRGSGTDRSAAAVRTGVDEAHGASSALRSRIPGVEDEQTG